jgi:hypothetical protein
MNDTPTIWDELLGPQPRIPLKVDHRAAALAFRRRCALDKLTDVAL